MVNAHVVGDGQHRVIALNGWFSDRTGYDGMWPYLDGDTFSYAFMDYRGYGESIGIPGEYTLSEVAEDVLTLADELDWSSFSLLGHSMGGVFIQQVLANAPDRVRALVAICAVPASGAPFDNDAWALFASAPDNVANRRAIIDLVTGNRLATGWLDAMAARSVATSDRHAFARYLPEWAKADLVERIAGSALQVKVIAGEHDPALPAELMRTTWLQHYPNAELEVMPNVGHYPMDETPIALLTSIETFLRNA